MVSICLNIFDFFFLIKFSFNLSIKIFKTPLQFIVLFKLIINHSLDKIYINNNDYF